MGEWEVIKGLARLPQGGSPFLTLYLDTRWSTERERERVRIFVKSRLRQYVGGLPRLARGGREDAEKIECYVKGLVNREWDEAYNGIAVFACSGLGVYRVVKSHIPFVDEFRCSDRPVLRQVVENLHEGERGILAFVGADSGRLYEFHMGGVVREYAFEDDEFPGRHDQGGWSQARYQRHIGDHLHRNLRRLAGKLVNWVDEHGVRRIAVAGPEETVPAFERELPERVLRRVCARLHVDPHAGFEEVQREALDSFRSARRREDCRRVMEVLERRGRRAAVGLRAVAGAVRDGKVHRLFLDRTFHVQGWKCFACGEMGERAPLGCPRCGGSVEAVELGEEFIRGVLAADGRVFVVTGVQELVHAGGVAAGLRY